MDVVVVGSVNVDIIANAARRPGPGETIFGSDFVTAPGGKGANQAAAVASLGGDVALIGRIGDDDRGDVVRKNLEVAGVDTRLLKTTHGIATGSALVMVTPDGENAIIVSSGANAFFSELDIDAAASTLQAASVVLAQLEVSMATVARACTCSAMASGRVILNASPYVPLSSAMLEMLDPLVVNEHEAASFLARPVETSTATGAVQGLLECGVRSAVITLGADGAFGAVRGKRPFHVPAPSVPVVDTTGAGDAFAGALALTLARGATLETAVRAGVAAGSQAVQRLGAQGLKTLPHR